MYKSCTENVYKVKIIYYLYYKYNLTLDNKHVNTFELIVQISIISIIQTQMEHRRILDELYA